MWKDDLNIIMKEGLINYHENEISLVGKLIIKVKNIDDFYKSFQIKKVYRKDIKEVELDFIYNLDKNKFKFDNILINQISSTKTNKFIKKFNSSDKIFTNKITLKKFINEFFSYYSG